MADSRALSDTGGMTGDTSVAWGETAGTLRLAGHGRARADLDGRPRRRGAEASGVRGRARVRHAAARSRARRVAGRLPPHGPRGARRCSSPTAWPPASPTAASPWPRPTPSRSATSPGLAASSSSPASATGPGRRGRPRAVRAALDGVRRRGRPRRVLRGAQPPPTSPSTCRSWAVRLAPAYGDGRPVTPSCGSRWRRSTAPAATPPTRSPPTSSWSTSWRRARSTRPPPSWCSTSPAASARSSNGSVSTG